MVTHREPGSAHAADVAVPCRDPASPGVGLARRQARLRAWSRRGYDGRGHALAFLGPEQPLGAIVVLRAGWQHAALLEQLACAALHRGVAVLRHIREF